MIPVVWLSLHDDILARGYWDQGLIEDILDRSAWRPVAALGYEHYEVHGQREWPDLPGGVLIVPARHHAADVDWIVERLAAWAWVLVILCGDEDAEFPLAALTHPNMRVWVMTPDEDRHGELPDRRIGTSYPPDTPEILAGFDSEAMSRPFDWYFAGQVTHERREVCVSMFSQQAQDRGEAHPSDGFTRGLSRPEYLRGLAATRIAPCPSGPCSPDTMRLWEALEAGALPIADLATPKGNRIGFWSYLLDLDETAVPFPTILAWGVVPRLYDDWLARWPENANRASAWWQGYKRTMAYWLDDDVRALARALLPGDEPDTLAERITVIITTSPCLAHPSIDPILQTIRSIRRQPGFADVEIIVAADGVRPEQERLRPRYDEYLRRLLWQLNIHEHNVVPLLAETWGHQANTTRAALDLVRTDLMLFVEHDTPLVGVIDWTGLVARLDDDAYAVRFYHEASIHPDHAHLMLDEIPSGDPPLVRTVQWSQRPHLARVSLYRRILDAYFSRDSRTMIEDVMHGVVAVNWQEYGEVGWGQFRLFVYVPDTPEIKRSTHLDTRGDEPKYAMIFDYDGKAPVGAPQASPRKAWQYLRSGGEP
jgi:hypothetical protein